MIRIPTSQDLEQLRASIEAIRSQLHRLGQDGADESERLALSEHLDKLINDVMSIQFEAYQRRLT